MSNESYARAAWTTLSMFCLPLLFGTQPLPTLPLPEGAILPVVQSASSQLYLRNSSQNGNWSGAVDFTSKFINDTLVNIAAIQYSHSDAFFSDMQGCTCNR